MAGVVAEIISLSEFSDTGCVTFEAGGVGGCTRGDCETLANEMVDAELDVDVAVDAGRAAVDVVDVFVCTWW